jgi:hypothetical protein
MNTAMTARMGVTLGQKDLILVYSQNANFVQFSLFNITGAGAGTALGK